MDGRSSGPSPPPSALPSPDRSSLIAFPRLCFAGNGLKHDMRLTWCLPRERERCPTAPARVKSQSERLKQRGLLLRADIYKAGRPAEGKKGDGAPRIRLRER